MTDWQPIETAPKNGTRILGYNPTLIGPVICEWHPDGWWADADAQGGGGYNDTPLSHWMPLPPPPNPHA